MAEVAFDLFEREGYESVTMERIASTADVARGTLYNHFPVKPALLDHYFRNELSAGVEALLAQVERAATLNAQLTRLFDVFARWAERRRAYLPASLAYGAERQLTAAAESGARDELHGVFVHLIERARLRGEIAKGADTSTLADYLEHLYLAATLRWLGSGKPSPKVELGRMLRFFLRGAAAPARRAPRRSR